MSSGIYILPGTQPTTSTFGGLDLRDDLTNGSDLIANTINGGSTNPTTLVRSNRDESILPVVCSTLDKTVTDCDTEASTACDQFASIFGTSDRTADAPAFLPAAFASLPSSILSASVLDRGSSYASSNTFTSDTRDNVLHQNLFGSNEFSLLSTHLDPEAHQNFVLTSPQNVLAAKLTTTEKICTGDLSITYQSPSSIPFKKDPLQGNGLTADSFTSRNTSGSNNQVAGDGRQLMGNQSVVTGSSVSLDCKQGTELKSGSSQLRESTLEPAYFNAATTFTVFPNYNILSGRNNGLLLDVDGGTSKPESAVKQTYSRHEQRFGHHATRSSSRAVNGSSRGTKFSQSKRKDSSDEPNPYDTTQTYSTGACSSLSRSSYMCRKCRAHGKLLPVKQHKRNCPFRSCSCAVCSLVNRGRQIVAKQIALYRDQKTHSLATTSLIRQQTMLRSLDPLDKFRAVDGYAFKPLKNPHTGLDGSGEDEGPHCRRCRNHGRSNPWKGHKKTCPYRCCTCQQCILISLRKSNEKDLREVVQEFNSERTEKREPANKADADSLNKCIGTFKDEVNHEINPNSNHYFHSLGGAVSLSSLGLKRPHPFFPYPYLSRLTEVYSGNKNVTSPRMNSVPLSKPNDTMCLPPILSHPFSMTSQFTGQTLCPNYNTTNYGYRFNLFGQPSNYPLDIASGPFQSKMHLDQTNIKIKQNDEEPREHFAQRSSHVPRSSTLDFARGVAGVLLDTMAHAEVNNVGTSAFPISNEVDNINFIQPSVFASPFLLEGKSAHGRCLPYADYEQQIYFPGTGQQTSGFGNSGDVSSKPLEQPDQTCCSTQTQPSHQAFTGIDGSSGLWASASFSADVCCSTAPNVLTNVTNESMFRSLVESVTQQHTPICTSLDAQSVDQPESISQNLNPKETNHPHVGSVCSARAQQAAAIAAAAAAAVALQQNHQQQGHHEQESQYKCTVHPYAEASDRVLTFDANSLLPVSTSFANSRCDMDGASIAPSVSEHVGFSYPLGSQVSNEAAHQRSAAPKASPTECPMLDPPCTRECSMNYVCCDPERMSSSSSPGTMTQRNEAKSEYLSSAEVSADQENGRFAVKVSKHLTSTPLYGSEKPWDVPCTAAHSDSWQPSTGQNIYKADEDKQSGYANRSALFNTLSNHKQLGMHSLGPQKNSETETAQVRPSEHAHSYDNNNSSCFLSSEPSAHSKVDNCYVTMPHTSRNPLSYTQTTKTVVRNFNTVSVACAPWSNSTAHHHEMFVSEESKPTGTPGISTWLHASP
ncbi:hypothetical protein T265_06110 [Opisthorchis viverrini]|uniref:DM domain-containing protein n=1 Tax=Opisthorchis viverrini TaxID=6198 RepID=A0A075AEF9_OPIVI|nr:hypothetical protein T265_06110 [Opisthorchis viverrini]KER26674.1 hypothetical protein T265_06110 [Opisthorchis viverrini]